MESNDKRTRKGKQDKKAWTTPKLVEHGDVEKVTADISGSGTDGILGSVPGVAP
ncbi:MAG: lasso RiPP family leader peptide-containing protein [Verrucomicrobia bacterium]|nr:lasso RiPP family leader peptide-containing protein [Verrucomicrobiota bacterium]